MTRTTPSGSSQLASASASIRSRRPIDPTTCSSGVDALLDQRGPSGNERALRGRCRRLQPVDVGLHARQLGLLTGWPAPPGQQQDDPLPGSLVRAEIRMNRNQMTAGSSATTGFGVGRLADREPHRERRAGRRAEDDAAERGIPGSLLWHLVQLGLVYPGEEPKGATDPGEPAQQPGSGDRRRASRGGLGGTRSCSGPARSTRSHGFIRQSSSHRYVAGRPS